MENIQGVHIKHLKVAADERGWLMEILRCDDEVFQQFGQVYVTTAYPEWSRHGITIGYRMISSAASKEC